MPYNGNSTNTNCWTLASCTAAIMREVLDPTNQWWTQAELAQYVNDWQNIMESQFEFVWGTATVSSTAGTLTLTNIDPNMLRLDSVYLYPGTGPWGTDTATRRLSGRTRIDLDERMLTWAQVTTNTGLLPDTAWQDDIYTVSFFPPPPGTCTYIFEYPVLTTLVNPTDVISVPCWTRYSVIQYGAYKCYARFGPNQDLNKAMRRKRRWEEALKKFRKVYDAYIPQGNEMLRPGRRYAGRILTQRQGASIWPVGNGNL